MELPEHVKAAIDEKVFVHMATVMPDGSPQVSVIWIGRDGDKLLFSTAEGRVKTNNIRRDNRVGLSFTGIGKDYENIVLRGRVTKFEPDGRWLIDELSRKYFDKDYPLPEGQIRVNGEIEIDKVGRNH